MEGPPILAVRDAVARALAEDLLPMGDLTAALIPPGTPGRAVFAARAGGVLAGRACAEEALAQVDGDLRAEWQLDDGAVLEPGSLIGTVTGPLGPLLTAERTALNFLGHLSGVATLTYAYVQAVGGTRTRILDTRKTTPGLRALEKAAVRAGGGHNHRGNLSEGVLVKDNHLAGLTIAEAVAAARSRWPGRMVEVECDRLEQVAEALAAGATMILLDNMDPPTVAEAAALSGGRALLEVSGRISLEAAPKYAAAGVDFISVGALTHSAPVLDIGLDLDA